MTSPILTWLNTEHGDMIKRIARKEHRGVQTVSADDIEQQLYAEFGSRAHPKDPNAAGTDFRTWDTPGIAALATRMARQYVARERIEYMHFAGAFVYTPKIVEAYLQTCVWVELEDVPDIDGRVDVVAAVKSLSLRTQQELFHVYGRDLSFPNDSAERKRVERAVEKISDMLNMNSGVKIGDMADAA